ncbi:MAG TPA: amidohydrolase family protein [Candidatus Binatia bacterium]|nr:amidohydrolase family protein [Candidatus Binatia bacterium]
MIRIDSDTHFTPLDAFADLDPKYSDRGPRVVALPAGRYRIDYPARAPHVPAHIKPLRVNGRPRSDFEIEPRLEAMAQDGFDMQVLIPNNSPFYYDVDPAMGANVSRAYNKSISRILKRYPNKFIGIAAAPLQDVKLAIAEAEHAVKELGLHSVIIYQNVNRQDLDSEFLWPFYEAVEKLGVPLSVHGVDSGPLLGVERFARYNLDVCLGFPFEVFTAISALIFSGLLARFPALKFGFFEVGIGWIPWLLDRLEMAYDARPAAREKAKRRPRECFDNFYFSFGAEDSTLADVVKRIGSSRLMIGSDYPHPDGTSPNTVAMLRARQGLSQSDMDNLLGGTAAEFFNLPREL